MSDDEDGVTSPLHQTATARMTRPKQPKRYIAGDDSENEFDDVDGHSESDASDANESFFAVDDREDSDFDENPRTKTGKKAPVQAIAEPK
jgi:hypothetical protein